MKGRILVVDDEAEIRGLLKRHYSLEGYEVDEAANGREACERLEARRYDLVISDIMMPEMDGVELLGLIRQEYPMTRVVMITGYVKLSNALACMRRGADSCVFKPLLELDELDEAVELSLRMLRRWESQLKQLHAVQPEK